MKRYGLHFDMVESGPQQTQLASFMREHAATYDPIAHQRWIDGTCMPAIVKDERRALAWWQNGQMVGNAVLKIDGPNVIEIKNFRVAQKPGVEGRGLGHFMMQQVLYEAPFLLGEKGRLDGSGLVVLKLDTTAKTPAQGFFENEGFETVGVSPLYIPGRQEALMQRTLQLAA